MAPGSPEIHNNLLGVLGVKGQVVVGTPRGQVKGNTMPSFNAMVSVA